MLINCGYCGKEFSKPPSKIRKHKRHFCSKGCADKAKITQVELNCDTCNISFNRSASMVGPRNYCSKKCKDKGLSGEGAPNWKGGATVSRDTLEYRAWRLNIYARDNYTCTYCGTRGGNLVAHHILPYATHKDARLLSENGVTLCTDCHTAFHKTYGYKGFGMEDFIEWLQNKRD